jgi:uncharacterized protein YycO
MTHTTRLVIAGAALLFIAFSGACGPARPRQNPKIDAVAVIPVLQDGDIICRLGDRIWSLYFRDFSEYDRRFSHLGIVRIRNGAISIINAEGQSDRSETFVQEVSLEKFVSVAKTIGVYRMNSVSGTAISDEAMNYIGRPFDWNFDMSDESAIYCTELLYGVLKQVAPEITLKTLYINEIKQSIIPLESVSGSADFTEILYITASK